MSIRLFRSATTLAALFALAACHDSNKPGPQGTSPDIPVLGQGLSLARYTGEVNVRGNYAYTSTWNFRGTVPGNDPEDTVSCPGRSIRMPVTAPQLPQLTDDLVESYRTRGFVRIPQILTPPEVERFRDAVVAYRERVQLPVDQSVFAQYVDVWRQDQTLAELTRHPALGEAAERLAPVVNHFCIGLGRCAHELPRKLSAEVFRP